MDNYERACCSCSCSSRQAKKSIIFSALIALLLSEVVTKEGLDFLGSSLSSIGQLLETASSAQDTCSVKRPNTFY